MPFLKKTILTPLLGLFLVHGTGEGASISFEGFEPNSKSSCTGRLTPDQIQDTFLTNQEKIDLLTINLLKKAKIFKSKASSRKLRSTAQDYQIKDLKSHPDRWADSYRPNLYSITHADLDGDKKCDLIITGELTPEKKGDNPNNLSDCYAFAYIASLKPNLNFEEVELMGLFTQYGTPPAMVAPSPKAYFIDSPNANGEIIILPVPFPGSTLNDQPREHVFLFGPHGSKKTEYLERFILLDFSSPIPTETAQGKLIFTRKRPKSFPSFRYEYHSSYVQATDCTEDCPDEDSLYKETIEAEVQCGWKGKKAQYKCDVKRKINANFEPDY